MKLCVLVILEVIPIMSHKHNSTNMRRTRTTTIDMPKGKGKKRRNDTKNRRQLRNPESSLFHGVAHHFAVQFQMLSPENLHTSDLQNTEQLHSGIYIFSGTILIMYLE